MFLSLIIWFSSVSFLGYGISYFLSSNMKQEFVRFGLSKFGSLTAVLEIAGALGLLVGFFYPPILVLSSGGLALLMLLGVGVRIKMKDNFLLSFPALFFLILNGYILYQSILAI